MITFDNYITFMLGVCVGIVIALVIYNTVGPGKWKF